MEKLIKKIIEEKKKELTELLKDIEDRRAFDYNTYKIMIKKKPQEFLETALLSLNQSWEKRVREAIGENAWINREELVKKLLKNYGYGQRNKNRL